MARINTNVSSLIAQNNLARTGKDLSVRLQRLSTGLRINRGSDDPAGLIVSERLRSELRGIDQAISNSERASSVIATTEGYLAEIADLLVSIQSLVVEAANTGGVSKEEIAANQLQVDSAIESITRIANTASFAGLRLLDGSLEYITSGVPTSAIAQADIFGAQFGNASSVTVEVEVITSALTAQLFLSGNTAGSVGALQSSVTIEVAGNIGVQSLTFVSGTSLSAVVAAVNTVTAATGVSAALVNASVQSSGMTFNSVSYGSDQFVSVRKLGSGGDFFATYDEQDGNAIQRDTGRDVVAIVNGALATGDGLTVSLNTPTLALDMDLTAEYAQVTGSAKSFTITGGGAVFQLGPEINARQQTGLGVQSVAASRIGGASIAGIRYFLDSIATGKGNDLASDPTSAGKIVDAAIDEIALLRGRLGSFERNTIQTNIRALEIGFENISSSESKVRDADFAEETARLSRAQIMNQAGVSALAISNTVPQSVLSLLG